MNTVHLPLVYEGSNMFTTTCRPVYPIRLSIEETMIPASTATMICTRDELYKRSQVFELFTANGSAGRFRIRSIDIDEVGDTVTYQLEHMIAEVGNWVLINDISGNKVQRTALRQLWRGVDSSSADDNNYRGSVWQLGSVTALSDTTTVELDAKNGDNLLNAINGLLQNCPGIYMTFAYSTDPWTINFADYTNASSAYGLLDRNVSSARVYYDFTDLATRVRYKYSNTWRSQTAGSSYTNAYGVVEHAISTDGATSLASANYMAQQYLIQHREPRITIEIDGYDLSSITGVPEDKFTIGKQFHLYVPELVGDFYRSITRLRWDDVFGDPLRVHVTLGDDDPTLWAFLTDIIHKK